jgi:hypothetical protein
VPFQDVRQWPRQIRHHRPALWRGENSRGNHRKLHGTIRPDFFGDFFFFFLMWPLCSIRMPHLTFSRFFVLFCFASVSLCCQIKKSTLVFCTTATAVDQWRRQFMFWTDIDKRKVVMFTAAHKQKWDPKEAVVVITSYPMVGYNGTNRPEATTAIMELIQSQEWGLILLDEV